MASFLLLLTPLRCDAGVADQLQTNYASDLRSILKTLFEVMATKCEQAENDKEKNGKATFWGVYMCEMFLFSTICKVSALVNFNRLLLLLRCPAGPVLRSAVLEDCALCQETVSSSEVAAKACEGQFEGQEKKNPLGVHSKHQFIFFSRRSQSTDRVILTVFFFFYPFIL